MLKCECEKIGKLIEDYEFLFDIEKELPFVNHLPNKCKCKNELQEYIRKGKKIILCSNCVLSGDKKCLS